MTHETNKVHSAAVMFADEFKAGKLSRREFLTRATALGVASAAAYTLGGLQQPAAAAGHMKASRKATAMQSYGTMLTILHVLGASPPKMPTVESLLRRRSPRARAKATSRMETAIAGRKG